MAGHAMIRARHMVIVAALLLGALEAEAANAPNALDLPPSNVLPAPVEIAPSAPAQQPVELPPAEPNGNPLWAIPLWARCEWSSVSPSMLLPSARTELRAPRSLSSRTVRRGSSTQTVKPGLPFIRFCDVAGRNAQPQSTPAQHKCCRRRCRYSWSRVYSRLFVACLLPA